MAFDISTAKPVSGGFDLSTAKPVDDRQVAASSAESEQSSAQPRLPNLPGGAPAPTDEDAGRVLDVLGEYSASVNRTFTEAIDFLLSDTANSMLSLSGSDYRVPTITGLLEPTGIRGGFMEPGTARDAIQAAGLATAVAMGLKPVVGRNVATPSGAAAELAGFGSAAPTQTALEIANTADDLARLGTDDAVRAADDAPPGYTVRKWTDFTGKKVDRELAAKRGGHAPSAGYKLDETGRVVPDKAQKQALKAGLNKGIVAQVGNASMQDKTKMSEMLDIVEGGLSDKTYADYHLPRVVLGDSMYDRYKIISDVNKQAGKDVGREVKRLSEIPLDGAAYLDGPVKNLFESLYDAGVKVVDGELNFSKSRFRGSPGAQKILKKVFKEMLGKDANSLIDVHDFKTFLDDMVDEYQSSSKGLSKKAEGIVYQLRKDTNNFLRQYSDEYADANDRFSETIDLINRVERLIGKNNAADSTNLARTARKALSNYQTSNQVLEVLDDLDVVAKKYGGEFSDDIRTQASLVQTIEKLFPSAKPPASFGGEIDKSLDYAGRVMTGGSGNAMVDAATSVGKKVLGKSPERKQQEIIDALRELTRETPATAR